jgi:hypothetical protein
LKAINQSPSTQAEFVDNCVSNPAWKEHKTRVFNPARKEHVPSELSPLRFDTQKVHKTVIFDLVSNIERPCMQHPYHVDYPNPDPLQDPDPNPDPGLDLTIPDLSNVLITHKVPINGIQATALIDSGAQEDFVDTHFVLAYNMPTSTSSHKRYVSLANGTRQDASATLTNATMVMTARPEEGSHLFEDIINPTVTVLGRL